MKNSIVFGVVIVLLGAIFCWQSLRLSGFCYREGKWLSSRELADHYLLGRAAGDSKRYSYKEKTLHLTARQAEKEIMRLRKTHDGCCLVSKTPWWFSRSDVFFNGILFNRYFYEIDEYLPVQENQTTGRDSYEKEYFIIGACGYPLHPEMGEGLSFAAYQRGLDAVKKFWERNPQATGKE